MELKPFIDPEKYFIELSRITQSTPEQAEQERMKWMKFS